MAKQGGGRWYATTKDIVVVNDGEGGDGAKSPTGKTGQTMFATVAQQRETRLMAVTSVEVHAVEMCEPQAEPFRIERITRGRDYLVVMLLRRKRRRWEKGCCAGCAPSVLCLL